MATQLYSTGRDKSTYQGGYLFMVKKIDAMQVEDAWPIHDMIWEHRSIPTDERSSFWRGGDAALMDTLARLPSMDDLATDGAL